MVVFRSISLNTEKDQDVIALLDAAPNASALVRSALRAYQEQTPAMALLGEISEQVRRLREEIRAAGVRGEAAAEPEEAVAALDDILDRFGS